MALSDGGHFRFGQRLGPRSPGAALTDQRRLVRARAMRSGVRAMHWFSEAAVEGGRELMGFTERRLYGPQPSGGSSGRRWRRLGWKWPRWAASGVGGAP